MAQFIDGLRMHYIHFCILSLTYLCFPSRQCHFFLFIAFPSFLPYSCYDWYGTSKYIYIVILKTHIHDSATFISPLVFALNSVSLGTFGTRYNRTLIPQEKQFSVSKNWSFNWVNFADSFTYHMIMNGVFQKVVFISMWSDVETSFFQDLQREKIDWTKIAA